MQNAQYVWTFTMGERVEWSGETHASIERRIKSYPGVNDEDREEVIAFMEHVEKDQQATFCVFPKFDTILFYMPGVL